MAISISDDEAKLEALWKSEFSLMEFTDPKKFKTYDQLKQRLTKTLGTAVGATTAEDGGALNDADSGVKSSEKSEVLEAVADADEGEMDPEMMRFQEMANG